MRGSRGADPGSLGPLSTHAGVTAPGYNAEIRAYYDSLVSSVTVPSVKALCAHRDVCRALIRLISDEGKRRAFLQSQQIRHGTFRGHWLLDISNVWVGG